jgi:hypothetical protein
MTGGKAASQDRRQSSQRSPAVWTGDNAAKGSAQACELTITRMACIVQKKNNISAKTSI